jgi:branched-chain amino acid transport system ATP-binding protein
LAALLGPNSAGKTTALRVAAGVHPIQSGRLLLGGRDVTGTAPRDLARAGVCLSPKDAACSPNLSVRDNLLMMTFTGRAREEIEEIASRGSPASPAAHRRRPEPCPAASSRCTDKMEGGKRRFLSGRSAGISAPQP